MEVCVKISVILLLVLFESYHCFNNRIIIIEDAKACFRRALAGQRAIRSLVRRSVRCERLQECQQQCANEKRFFCEAFNFRLGPVIGANGDCDLLDIPVLGLDRWREIVSDPDFDVYERDRNSGPNCNALSIVKSHKPPPPPPSISDRFDRRPSYPEDVRRYDRRPYYDDRRTYDKYGDGYYKDEYHHRSQYYGSVKYLPIPMPQIDYKDKYYYDREKDRNFWGFEKWGSYGGVYGNFGKPASHYGKFDGNRRNDYLPAKAPSWQDTYHTGSYETRFPSTTSVNFGKPHQGFRPITTERPWTDYYNYGSYYNGGHEIQHPPSPNGGYHYDKPHKEYGLESPNYLPTTDKPDFHPPKPNFQSLLPPKLGPNIITENTFYSISDDVVEHKRIEPPGYDFLKDECSLRTATGFKLHKTSVRKLYQVPDIYECEMLCFTETDFNCLSYAFRYTSNAKAQNCYLSHKSYKALDFYTDLEPNRDFDVYTMNNLKKCTAKPRKNDLSDCFWHVRSGLRLDQSIVRDTINVKSVADCELECIRSSKFLCRSFSFRYGSPVIGGIIDNCQLTDWPFMELDLQSQLNPEQGFDIYERGSFGYGCEPNHFSIRGKEEPAVGSKTDQLCYVGYGRPAKLLPQAIRKSIFVNSELDCKLECTKSREHTLLHCMSFSFRNNPRRGESNCDLSDIHQRDLVGKVDFIYDDDSWLFAWDSNNPECVPIYKVAPNHGRENTMDIWRYNALDTWRVYSVSGFPCKRGTSCKENREAGFWFCELEGGDEDIWDYCCRPSHQCGYSEGFAYQWCYVGPDRTQWRQCSERYYPYLLNNNIDHKFTPKPYVPDINFRPDPIPFERPHFRPNRPLAPPAPPPRRPSLNEYEQKFNMQFLDPPKPGGFGEPRRWPVSYLHKEMPQGETNSTELKFDRMRSRQNIAIHNLINIIKSKDINNIEYQITNKTSKMNDILLVKIPLPTNFTESSSSKPEKMKKEEKVSLSEPIDLKEEAKNTTGIKINTSGNKRQGREYSYEDNFEYRPLTFRRGFVTRANISDYGHRF
ncbi:PREDICTED: uncharacterized protein LOC108569520 [Nicrophorus vespilloides]|uniref:Uncharacterized protein LOC108569520 n=1 Tax=Nicrophorus vespilloides TaxID=110193 RepID=A0ABM1NIE7_NICVS|nr:PREDICTED: uncharacterized protein LOC108569520 [Nicrophorus vespilloides]